MSYRLIDSNAIAFKYPEVNEMPCVFADLPDGMNGQFIDAQPERKKGEWIITDIYNGMVWKCHCSECGELAMNFVSGLGDWWMKKLPNFCPNCGADMREEKTDD